jgi:hypothetical protein
LIAATTFKPAAGVQAKTTRSSLVRATADRAAARDSASLTARHAAKALAYGAAALEAHAGEAAHGAHSAGRAAPEHATGTRHVTTGLLGRRRRYGCICSLLNRGIEAGVAFERAAANSSATTSNLTSPCRQGRRRGLFDCRIEAGIGKIYGWLITQGGKALRCAVICGKIDGEALRDHVSV